jgi:hypothetical protein
VVQIPPAVPAITAFIEPLTAPGTRDLSGWGTHGGRKRGAHRAAKSDVATEPAAKNFAGEFGPSSKASNAKEK